MIRLAIVGSRKHDNYKEFEKNVREWIKVNGTPEVIISGGAEGADKLAKRFATENNYTFIEYPAQWNMYGKAAGPMRNQKIVDEATHMIAFPLDAPGTGAGTKDSLTRMQKAKKPHTEFTISLNSSKKRKAEDDLKESNTAID